MKKKWYVIALWMIILIISLPMIHAQSVSITQMSGEDGIENVISVPDTLTIKATVSLPGDSQITPDQLRIVIDKVPSYQIFAECSTGTSGATCTYTQQFFARPNEPLTYHIRLFDDANKFRDAASPVAEQTRTLLPDFNGATVDTITITPPISKDGKFNVNFLAKDTGITGQSHCAGIKEVKIFSGSKSFATQQGNKDCNFATNVAVDVTLPDGEYEICAQAYDQLDQTDPSGNKCQKVIKDAEAPKPTLMELFQDGQRVEVIRPAADNFVDVFVTITDPSLDETTVRADLSALTTSTGYTDIPASTVVNGQAIWRGVPTGGMSECLGRITAADQTGNRVDKDPIGCSVVVDNTGPQVQSFTTGIVDEDGKEYLPEKGMVKVTFSDDLSGVDKGSVALDLSQVNGLTNVRPDICESQGSGNQLVECTWFVTASKSGGASIFLETTSADKLGNRVDQNQGLTVFIDRDPPEIVATETEIFDGTSGEIKENDVAVRDDTVSIRIVAKNAVRALGNFSAIGVDEAVVGECVTVGADSECVFSGVVDASDDSGEPVEIYFFDEVNNRVTHKEFIPVFGLTDDDNPNYWRTDRVICTPEAVDNRVTEFINYKITCAALLKPLSRRTKIINVDLDPTECSAGSSAVSDITLSNTAVGTQIPLMNILLKTERYQEPLNFTCPLRLTSQVGSKVTKVAEIEEVNVNIGFFTNPLGEAGDQLDRKVLKAIKDADKMFGWVGDLKKVIDYLEKVCKVKQQINNLLVVINGVFLILSSVGSVLMDIGITAGAGKALKSIANSALKSGVYDTLDQIFNFALFEIIDSMCIFLNCGAASDSDDGATLSVISSAGGGGPGGYCTKLQKYLNDLLPNFKGGDNFGGGVVEGEQRSPVQVKVDSPPAQQRIEQTQRTDENTQTREPPVKGFSVDSLAFQPLRIKDSLIWSVACLCLPGIIHNLEKWHQLQCKYAVCLGNEVRGRGLPVSFCDEQKDYDECAFVFNQIFNAIPFSSILEDFGKLLETVLTDPVALVSTVLGVVCDLAACNQGVLEAPHGEIGCSLCLLFQEISKVADAVMSLKTFTESLDTFFEVDNGYCGQMEDLEKEIKQEQHRSAQQAVPDDDRQEGVDDPGLIDFQDRIDEAVNQGSQTGGEGVENSEFGQGQQEEGAQI